MVHSRASSRIKCDHSLISWWFQDESNKREREREFWENYLTSFDLLFNICAISSISQFEYDKNLKKQETRPSHFIQLAISHWSFSFRRRQENERNANRKEINHVEIRSASCTSLKNAADVVNPAQRPLTSVLHPLFEKIQIFNIL